MKRITERHEHQEGLTFVFVLREVTGGFADANQGYSRRLDKKHGFSRTLTSQPKFKLIATWI